jgi:hypothetical protein
MHGVDRKHVEAMLSGQIGITCSPGFVMCVHAGEHCFRQAIAGRDKFKRLG